MKHFLKYILVAIIITGTFSACKKAISDEFVSYPDNALNDTVWATSGYNTSALNRIIFPEITKTTLIVDSFNCFSEGKLNFGDSLQITFPANACIYLNGTPITNGATKVKAEITLLNKRGDFIKYGAPTTNVFSLLEASNYCDIKLTKDGKEIMLTSSSTVKIKIKDSTAKGDMKLFAGNTIKFFKDSLFSWSPSNDGSVTLWKDNSGVGKVLGYEFITSRIRWFGAAYYTDSTLAKTRLNVILPPNYTNKNTAVFAVLKNKKTIINLLGEPNTKTFFTYNLPINTEFTLVAISKINGDYYLESKIIKAANANPVSLAPYKRTYNQILEFLEKL